MQAEIDGVTLAYDDSGSGPPVVLLHAFPLSKEMWRGQVEALRDAYRVIAPDLRGHGGSALRGDSATMEQMADDVLALLDRLGLGRVALGGLSMGGYVALNLARRHPGRLAALVLADTRAGADSAEGREGRAATARKALEQGAPAIADQLLPKLLAPATQRDQPGLVSEVRALIEATSPAAIAAASHGMAARADSTAALPAFGAPTLVLVGAEDALTPPSESEAMRAAIPGAQLEIIPGAGHLSNLEQPAAFNQALRGFLDGLPRAGDAWRED
ncbi:MAG TPA: alpha/beta fold hydrolase [Herpetosiphonaceae bacterium]